MKSIAIQTLRQLHKNQIHMVRKMKNLKKMVVLTLVIYFSLTCESFASDLSNCYDAKFSEVHSFSKFPRDTPSEVLYILDGVSDSDAPFSKGDVGEGSRERFSMAAISDECIFVVLEHGGLGYGVDLWYFVKNQKRWERGHQLHFHGNRVPKSVKELLANAENSIGDMYQIGEGAAKNEAQARKWYEKAKKTSDQN